MVCENRHQRQCQCQPRPQAVIKECLDCHRVFSVCSQCKGKQIATSATSPSTPNSPEKSPPPNAISINPTMVGGISSRYIRMPSFSGAYQLQNGNLIDIAPPTNSPSINSPLTGTQQLLTNPQSSNPFLPQRVPQLTNHQPIQELAQQLLKYLKAEAQAKLKIETPEKNRDLESLSGFESVREENLSRKPKNTSKDIPKHGRGKRTNLPSSREKYKDWYDESDVYTFSRVFREEQGDSNEWLNSGEFSHSLRRESWDSPDDCPGSRPCRIYVEDDCHHRHSGCPHSHHHHHHHRHCSHFPSSFHRRHCRHKSGRGRRKSTSSSQERERYHRRRKDRSYERKERQTTTQRLKTDRHRWK